MKPGKGYPGTRRLSPDAWMVSGLRRRRPTRRRTWMRCRQTSGQVSEWGCTGLRGTERAAVQIWPEGLVHEPIYLDDIDGSAWQLVAFQHGDPNAPYRMPDVMEVLEDLTEY
jgi:hypothetical protein